MRISSSLFTNNLLSQMNQLQGQQIQLQNQATTGLKVTLPEDDPAAMDQALDLQTQAAANTQYQSNITQLQSTATTAAAAMNSLQTITEQAGEIATEASGVNSSTQLATYATQVGNLIQEALQAANTQDAQGNYIFGGTINNQPPFAATTDASGNVTAVTYQGNTDASESQIGPGQTVSAQVPGENTTGTGPAGLLADSRSGADLFRDLISLQQNLTLRQHRRHRLHRQPQPDHRMKTTLFPALRPMGSFNPPWRAPAPPPPNWAPASPPRPPTSPAPTWPPP